MKQTNFFSFKPLLASFISLGLITYGCNNNDTTSAPSVSDTSTVTVPDTMMNHDTAMHSSTVADSATMKMGTAKPNPAKKGMKGKVKINESPKSTAAMEADNTGTYSNVEVYPSFPGGSKGLQEYFNKNLTYPSNAIDNGVEGTVNVMFTVDETGKLSGAHVMGDKLGYGLDEEALKVVNTMPNWQPGKLKGKNVKTKFTLPVSFELY